MNGLWTFNWNRFRVRALALRLHHPSAQNMTVSVHPVSPDDFICPEFFGKHLSWTFQIFTKMKMDFFLDSFNFQNLVLLWSLKYSFFFNFLSIFENLINKNKSKWWTMSRVNTFHSISFEMCIWRNVHAIFEEKKSNISPQVLSGCWKNSHRITRILSRRLK